jgi:hypothetical protein
VNTAQRRSPGPKGFGVRAFVRLLAALFIAVSFGAAAQAGEPDSMRGPGLKSSLRRPLGIAEAPDFLAPLHSATASGLAAPFLLVLDSYRTGLSPLDGNRCFMAPTCSIYALQAFREQGPLWGFVLTADRLVHEADEQALAQSYVVQGQHHYLDPLASNLYWLPDALKHRQDTR